MFQPSQECSKSKKIHQHAIHAICIKENVILTGSSDKTIKILSLGDLEELSHINCQELFKESVNPSIRALDVWENKILVGTLGS